MGRIKLGGYIFEFWVGDHPPRHVHVLRDRELLAKVELEKKLTLMEGKANRKIKKIIKMLVEKGILK